MPPPPPPATGHVHHYRATVAWSGRTAAGYEHYDRTHTAATDPPTAELRLSADPAFGGDAALLDPEQLLVLAASSCQLLSFLAVAARARIDVVDYRDEAEAVMPEADRPVRITRITLRPRITVAGPVPTERVSHLVEVAHRECYIARSVRSEIVVEPAITVIDATPDPPGT